MATNKKYKCPCCGYLTLEDENHFAICEVCYWEDDPIQREGHNYDGGANEMNLLEAKENFKKFEAISKEYVSKVRKPREDELE